MSAVGPTITIHLNGESRAVPAGQPLESLIESLGLPLQSVLVEHNGVALFRTDWESIHLTEGDRVEMLRVVAGG